MKKTFEKTPGAKKNARVYSPPRLVRVRVQTTRTQVGWQYAGDSTCTGHNHSTGDDGCKYPL